MGAKLGLSPQQNILRVLRGMFGPEGEKLIGWWGNLYSEELEAGGACSTHRSMKYILFQ
jgi:hypothetical protein